MERQSKVPVTFECTLLIVVCVGITALIMMSASALYVATGFLAAKSFFRTHMLQNVKNAFVSLTHIS